MQACTTLSPASAASLSLQLKLIGVAGANGKTATSCLIAGVLTAGGHRVGILGKLGCLDGVVVEPAVAVLPPPDDLAALLSRMAGNECSHVVMEVSRRALAESRVAGLQFDAVCLTNFSRDHLPCHPAVQDYRVAKPPLVDHLAPEGFAVVNADDPVSAGYLRRFRGPALTVGIRSAAEITAVPFEQSLSEQTFLLTAGSETVPVRTAMIGTHHIYNCLTAAAVGLAYGVELTTVARGLELVEHVPGRLERIECGQPFGVFVDVARTAESAAACLQTLRSVVSGRLICVFAVADEYASHQRPLLGAAVDGVDLVVPTAGDRRAAIHEALAQARPGDCVLLAGDPRDDREIAREWLYEVQPYAEVRRR